MSLYETARVLHGVGPYDTARRRAARMKVPQAVREACSRLAGLSRLKKIGLAGMREMARKGGLAVAASRSAEERLRIGRRAARIVNAKATPRQKSAWTRKGGRTTWRRLRAAGVKKGGRIAGMNLLSTRYLAVLRALEPGRRYTCWQIAEIVGGGRSVAWALPQRMAHQRHLAARRVAGVVLYHLPRGPKGGLQP